ncbi:MAG: type II toxin-antitoxin system prevent-host-death family antitoxin [Xenococcaceae cyanobacterium]
MYEVTLDYAKNNFEEIIERAKNDKQGVSIVQDNKTFLLIDKEELEAWTETAELLKNSDLLSDIEEAREEYRRGETLAMEDVFKMDND